MFVSTIPLSLDHKHTSNLKFKRRRRSDRIGNIKKSFVKQHYKRLKRVSVAKRYKKKDNKNKFNFHFRGTIKDNSYDHINPNRWIVKPCFCKVSMTNNLASLFFVVKKCSISLRRYAPGGSNLNYISDLDRFDYFISGVVGRSGSTAVAIKLFRKLISGHVFRVKHYNEVIMFKDHVYAFKMFSFPFLCSCNIINTKGYNSIHHYIAESVLNNRYVFMICGFLVVSTEWPSFSGDISTLQAQFRTTVGSSPYEYITEDFPLYDCDSAYAKWDLYKCMIKFVGSNQRYFVFSIETMEDVNDVYLDIRDFRNEHA